MLTFRANCVRFEEIECGGKLLSKSRSGPSPIGSGGQNCKLENGETFRGDVGHYLHLALRHFCSVVVPDNLAQTCIVL